MATIIQDLTPGAEAQISGLPVGVVLIQPTSESGGAIVAVGASASTGFGTTANKIEDGHPVHPENDDEGRVRLLATPA
ncbi:MAG: hypothetical protein F4Y00_00785 [Bacteroidetes bacterium SB0662_bin_6]|nr:hypothetical protein [Bacteroidetes bacterium SB0662_bin_6]